MIRFGGVKMEFEGSPGNWITEMCEAMICAPCGLAWCARVDLNLSIQFGQYFVVTGSKQSQIEFTAIQLAMD